MMNDPLSNALSKIMNAERLGRESCVVSPVSKVIKNVLEILKDNRYLGGFKETEDSRGNFFEVQLIGAINEVGAIKPRFAITKEEFESFEKRFLPAKDFGILIISTSKGMMTHTEAKKKGTGGKLIAYCY
jgi:small subunit ribosomal protein S8